MLAAFQAPHLDYHALAPEIILSGVVVLLLLVDLFGRWKQPWTHQFSLVLALWPLVPLAALLAWKIELK